MNEDQRNKHNRIEELAALHAVKIMQSEGQAGLSEEEAQLLELGQLLRNSVSTDLPRSNPDLRSQILKQLESDQTESVVSTVSSGALDPVSRKPSQSTSDSVSREGAWSRRAPRLPSYNETLLADKSFHNPHASETMADALDVFRPASFLVDVGADDRPWGGAAAAAAATSSAAAAARAGNDEGAAPAESRKGSDTENARGGDGSGSGDRSWFYDTVRDRQNRLWADTRVRKGVELARKGQHQVRAVVRLLRIVVRG